METNNVGIVVLGNGIYVDSLLIVQRNPSKKYCERSGCIVDVPIRLGMLGSVTDALVNGINGEVPIKSETKN